jgi:hypothetical protein
MHKTTKMNLHGKAFKYTEIRADRPVVQAPVIKRTYMDGDTEMIETTDGRQFNAQRFREMFTCKVSLPVLPEHGRRRNINTQMEALSTR